MKTIKNFIAVTGLLLSFSYCFGSGKQPSAKNNAQAEQRLMRAIRQQDASTIRSLTQQHPSLITNIMSRGSQDQNRTILINATATQPSNRNFQIIQAITENNPADFPSPLFQPILMQDIPGVQGLLNAGVDPNSANPDGTPMLHFAARIEGMYPAATTEGLVGILIQAGANVLTPDNTGRLAIELNPNNEILRQATLDAIMANNRTDLLEYLRERNII